MKAEWTKSQTNGLDVPLHSEFLRVYFFMVGALRALIFVSLPVSPEHMSLFISNFVATGVKGGEYVQLFLRNSVHRFCWVEGRN